MLLFFFFSVWEKVNFVLHSWFLWKPIMCSLKTFVNNNYLYNLCRVLFSESSTFNENATLLVGPPISWQTSLLSSWQPHCIVLLGLPCYLSILCPLILMLFMLLLPHLNHSYVCTHHLSWGVSKTASLFYWDMYLTILDLFFFMTTR